MGKRITGEKQENKEEKKNYLRARAELWVVQSRRRSVLGGLIRCNWSERPVLQEIRCRALSFTQTPHFKKHQVQKGPGR